MKAVFLGMLLLAGPALGGCKRAVPIDDEATSPPTRHGRYTGVGLYGADHGWAHLAGAPAAAGKAVATTADDTNIIVTVDGATGEIRQCGNYSGHCIAMNPWHGPLGSKQAEPVSLTARMDATGNSVAIDELNGNTSTAAK